MLYGSSPPIVEKMNFGIKENPFKKAPFISGQVNTCPNKKIL